METDAKYIKGMLENPDMMPTATINCWIDKILLYHFTLRHKTGATFGPDGLSRRPAQENDPIYELCSNDENEDPELPEFEVADLSEPQPLEIVMIYAYHMTYGVLSHNFYILLRNSFVSYCSLFNFTSMRCYHIILSICLLSRHSGSYDIFRYELSSI